MANNPNLPISTGNLNEYHTRVIGNLSRTGITGQTVAAQLRALNTLFLKKTMTAKFNLSDNNPATWGEYIDDATGMTAGSFDWNTFFGIKPVMIKNGEIVGELDPSQGYAKYKDGTSADITTGADGDVMIYVPRRDIHIWKENGYGYISFTDDLGKADYTHKAHTYKGNNCDWFGYGRYKGYYDGSKLRSLSGKTLSTQTINESRTYAQAQGTGYEQTSFYPLTYMQAMYMVKYLGQNAQTAVGRGFTASTNTDPHITGGTNLLGLDYGENTGTVQCSLFGIEDFWGNYNEFVDGFATDANRKIYTADGNFNTDGTGYTDAGTSAMASNVANYIKDLNWTDSAGFTPNGSGTGSATTYFCDRINLSNNAYAAFGGSYKNADYAGVFRLAASYAKTNAGTESGAGRLMFMHTAA